MLGFFYSGIGDITICYFCGLALRDWNIFFTTKITAENRHRDIMAKRERQNVYPLLEHAFWNSRCTQCGCSIDFDVTYVPRTVLAVRTVKNSPRPISRC